MSAEEGELSEVEQEREDGLESGEESGDEAPAPRAAVRSRGPAPAGPPRRPAKPPAGGPSSRGDFESRARPWSRQPPPPRRGLPQRGVDRPPPPYDGERRRGLPDRGPRDGGRRKPPPPSPHPHGRHRSGSRGPAAPPKVAERSPAVYEGARRGADPPAEAAAPPAAAQLKALQDLITIDSVCVSAAKESFQQMCSTVGRGLRALAGAWEAERARQRASTLHSHAEWDAVRERLLEGLRAIHLVCTAGVVQDISDLRTGLKTMQEALTNPAKASPQVVSWRDSLAAAELRARSGESQASPRHATAGGAAAGPPDAAPARRSRSSGSSSAAPESPRAAEAGHRPDAGAPAATGFVPRVKFRLDLKASAGVEMVRPASTADSAEASPVSPAAVVAPAATGPPPSTAHKSSSSQTLAVDHAEPLDGAAARAADTQAERRGAEAFAESPLSSSPEPDDRLAPLSGLTRRADDAAEHTGRAAASPEAVSVGSRSRQRSSHEGAARRGADSERRGASPGSRRKRSRPPHEAADVADGAVRRRRRGAEGGAGAPASADRQRNGKASGKLTAVRTSVPDAAIIEEEPLTPPSDAEPLSAAVHPSPRDAVKIEDKPLQLSGRTPFAEVKDEGGAGAGKAEAAIKAATPPPAALPTWDVDMSPVTSEEPPELPRTVKAEADGPAAGAPARADQSAANGAAAREGAVRAVALQEEPLTPPESAPWPDACARGAPAAAATALDQFSGSGMRAVRAGPVSSAPAASLVPSDTGASRAPPDPPPESPTLSAPISSPPPPLPASSPPPTLPAPPADAPPAAPPLALPPAAPVPPDEQPLHTLVSSGMLALVVNLEGTLIDIVKPTSISKWPPDAQRSLQQAAAAQAPRAASLIQLPLSKLWIKLRPGWHAALTRLACSYCLWLATELAGPAVAEIHHLLDPRQTLFGGRVAAGSAVLEDVAPRAAANGAAPAAPAKKRPVRRLQHLAGLAGVRPATLVLDNRQQMLWHARDAPHVVHCERYPFFPRISQGVANASFLAARRDESAAAGVLACAAEALEQIHQRSFRAMQATAHVNGAGAAPWDAVAAAAQQRGSVLHGAVLLFANNLQPLKESKVEHLREVAKQCGAACLEARPSAAARETATHVVATSADGDDVAWARRTQRCVVRPAWLLCCAHAWHQARAAALLL